MLQPTSCATLRYSIPVNAASIHHTCPCEVQQGCVYLGDKSLYVHNLLTLIPPSLMVLSPKPTKQNWHPSSLLAYATVPNSQDDIDSTTSEVKSTAETGTDFYDYSLTSRNYALAGVACTSIISCSFIIAGVVIVATSRATNGAFRFRSDIPEVLGLVMNLIVTLCTESTGLVHGISLRYALASESRLRFNTNLRLLTAARGWRNPNGCLLNGIMAILLIISYTSASLVILPFGVMLMTDDPEHGVNFVKINYVCISGPPLIVLGIALLLQVVISLSGMWAVKILTWSPSPFNLTAALVHHTQLTPVPFRCMRGMSESDTYGGPAKPSETQSSPWHAHGSIRKVIHFLWGLVVACAGWTALIALISWPSVIEIGAQNPPPPPLFLPIPPSPAQPLWEFIPADYTKLVSWAFPLSGGVTVQWWILSIVILALVQGLLTLGLHCSELIVNVIGDERCWRRATSRKGLRVTNNPLMQFFSNPYGLVLFVAKPVLRESFALASGYCH